MDQQEGVRRILQVLEPALVSSPDCPRTGSTVIMTCGIAGAGKSTLAKALIATHQNFTRISLDAIVASRHGLWGRDYPPSQYSAYQDEAVAIHDETLAALLRAGQDVVLDRSFYSREDRDTVKRAVEHGGGRWVLVYLRAEKEVLWRRICERRAKEVDADSALEITEELLGQYVAGFEAPEGEGEIVILVE